jgi:hypothetical protein
LAELTQAEKEAIANKYKSLWIEPTPVDSEWDNAVKAFLKGAGKAIAAKGERHLQAFDQYVQGVSENVANAKLTDRAMLAKAHKLFLEDFRGEFQRSEQPTKGQTSAALDRLAKSDPMALERVVASMTPAEREAYGI